MAGGASPRRRGDYFERQTKRNLEAQGWLVLRAGGSLGPCDLMAITRHKPPLLISCKLGGRIGKDEHDDLAMISKRYGAVALLAWRPRNGYVAYRLIGRNDTVSDDDDNNPAIVTR